MQVVVVAILLGFFCLIVYQAMKERPKQKSVDKPVDSEQNAGQPKE